MIIKFRGIPNGYKVISLAECMDNILDGIDENNICHVINKSFYCVAMLIYAICIIPFAVYYLCKSIVVQLYATYIYCFYKLTDKQEKYAQLIINNRNKKESKNGN